MDRQDKIKALELEIHGIDTELHEAKLLHRSLTIKIEYLEAERNKLKFEADHIRYEQRKLL